MELLDEILIRNLGLKVNHRTVPWPRAQFEVQQGESDFIIAIPTQERLKYSVSSNKPFFQLHMNIYTWTGHPKLKEIEMIENISDIKKLGLIIVTNAGNGWYKKHIEPLHIPTITIPADESVVQFLAKKRADILIDTPIPTNFIIKQYNLQSQLIMTQAHFGGTNLHLLLSKKSPFFPMMSKIDKAIQDAHDNGSLDRILQKHYQLQ